MLIRVMIFVLISVTTVQCAGRPTQCPAVEIKNRTTRWGSDDEKVLKRAQTRCKEIWSDSPCLKTFDKLDENRYTASCGSAN
jgi:hypothetical protein